MILLPALVPHARELISQYILKGNLEFLRFMALWGGE